VVVVSVVVSAVVGVGVVVVASERVLERSLSPGPASLHPCDSAGCTPARGRGAAPGRPQRQQRSAHLGALGGGLGRLLVLARREEALELLRDERLCARQVAALGQRQRQLQVVQLGAHKGHHRRLVHSGQQHLAAPARARGRRGSAGASARCCGPRRLQPACGPQPGSGQRLGS
jgi:hypothetical protein